MAEPPPQRRQEHRAASADDGRRQGLERHAGAFSLWALGVGAAISGAYFLWNFGLDAAGLGGLLIATVLAAILYVGLAYSTAEMAAALPFAGGAYAYARPVLGRWGGLLAGLADTMKYVLAPAAIVLALAEYFGALSMALFGFDLWAPVWWLIAYGLFVALNAIGAAAAFRTAVVLTVLALAVLFAFWIGALPSFSLELALTSRQGEGGLLPGGLEGIGVALPFAIWFFLAVEQVPLAAEESRAPDHDLPFALVYGVAALIVVALLTSVLAAGLPPGAAAIGTARAPLLVGFQTILGDTAWLIALIGIVALLASFHALIFASARNIYALSRAGYMPRLFALTPSASRTPRVALLAGAAVGLLAALVMEYGGLVFDDVPVGPAIWATAVFGAVIGYLLQMISFLLLRWRLPDMERPYLSPLGAVGAWVAFGLALLTLVFLVLSDVWRMGLYGCAAWFLVGLIYFAVHGRRRLVLSPEEAFAANRAQAAGWNREEPETPASPQTPPQPRSAPETNEAGREIRR